MTLQLFTVDEHPNRIAASKTGAFVSGGVFFLDFTRPLEKVKKYGLLVQGTLVPVVHQGEHHGEYVIGVDRADPCYAQVVSLWKRHYPSPNIARVVECDGLQIISDFARQFPEDSQ